MDTFTLQYLETALWSSCDDNGHPFDDNYDVDDFAESAIKQASDECSDFREYCGDLLNGVEGEQAAHDFWLTRNHHGAGFWDRGLKELGRKLTDAAHTYGSCDVYVGDDGKLYLS